MTIQILTTGLTRANTRNTASVVEEVLSSAKDEIQILAYVFTPHASKVLKLIENAAKRGLRITIVINSFEHQNEKIKSKLHGLVQEFSYVKVYDFESNGEEQLHAKMIIVDRKRAIIGSANLTWGGITSNYEIGVLLEGKDVWEISYLIDDLMTKMGPKLRDISLSH